MTVLLSVNLQLSIAQDRGSVVPSSTHVAEQTRDSAKRVVEYEIAGLRPGKDTVEKAYRRFGKDHVVKHLSGSDSAVWVDVCDSPMLTVTFDRNDIVRDATIQHSPGVTNADCDLKSYSRGVRSRMGGTRHDLVFRDGCDRVQEIYGAPQSQGESAHNKKELKYRYDLNGRSLTFDVTCDSVQNYVEAIKLTASGPAEP